ncbi:hypothetical protein ACNO7T_15725 [Vibrio campbellii]
MNTRNTPEQTLEKKNQLLDFLLTETHDLNKGELSKLFGIHNLEVPEVMQEALDIFEMHYDQQPVEYVPSYSDIFRSKDNGKLYYYINADDKANYYYLLPVCTEGKFNEKKVKASDLLSDFWFHEKGQFEPLDVEEVLSNV